MEIKRYDVAVIGCGAAGMAAALETEAAGYKTVILEREENPGGILNQCIHNGFGLHEFKEELTGPEYAGLYLDKCRAEGLRMFLQTTVSRIENREDGKRLICFSALHGMFEVRCRGVVLAMGCRERNRGNIGTPGTRPAGIFTAGLAQRLLNIDGYLPGRRVVIIGSGDIGLIMARRLSWVGASVLSVVEIRPYPSGLTRNIVQCLKDFSIPLYLGHIVSQIYGKDRVEGVEITPLHEHEPDHRHSFFQECDTVLLSVGLIPENELSRQAGVRIDQDTGGAVVDADYMTSVPGIFACGNVLHVHDLVDFVSAEARLCGQRVSAYLKGEIDPAVPQVPVRAGSNVRYVVPGYLCPGREAALLLRPMIVGNHVQLLVRQGEKVLHTGKLRHAQPSEMIRVKLGSAVLEQVVAGEEAVEVEIKTE